MAFRTTPILGPDIGQSEEQFYWDTLGDPAGSGDPSYQPGTLVNGSDGHLYRFVKAHTGLTKGGAFKVNDTTNVTEAGTGWTAPEDVAQDAWFLARSLAPAASA